MFPPLAHRTVRWRPVQGEGLEHLTLVPGSDTNSPAFRAESVVIGAADGVAYGARYMVEGRADWTVSALCVENTAGHRLSLRSDQPGRWTDEHGHPCPDFDGLIDIDLSATPFTNTLPIRRLGLTTGMPASDIAVLYIPFDTLRPHAHHQRYTCLKDGRLYRFEVADGSFAADLPVDADGLVLDYPELFRRL
ncbi:hypothetical protein SAMN05880582_1011664 [Rhizobium sp. RU20A]|uniref:putative glycolipid-binding domain-containing protein n=1 Tax=Rhizobium sp. RU20A TaxID=1907412 RepID=UPI0009543713|nr:putative glycolipid-binding domain-containing protein [Rhizobium sp. RU20A]SIQ38156.1 hypothetical protein SAMN05880582_1011664 [Rhizobium sp. RU20A]